MHAAPVHANGDDPGRGDFVEGLQAIAAGKFAEAGTSLSRAIDANGEDASYRVARAVALMMQEDGPGSRPDLDRAGRLSARHEARAVWLFVWTIMFDPYNLDRQAPYGSGLPYARPAIDAAPRYSRPGSERKQELQTLREIAGRYAWHELAKPENLGTQRGAVGDLYKQERYVECLALVNRLLARNRTDVGLRSMAAGCHLGLGEVGAARAIYTELLKALPCDPSLLMGRAIAAARMGSVQAAKADHALAQEISTQTATAYGANFELAMKQAASGLPVETPAQLLAALQAAAASESPAQLQVRGERLARADAAIRLDESEVYTQQLGRLQRAADADPANADKQVALAAFRLLPTVRVANRLATTPDSPPVRLRAGSFELTRARAALETALRINPDHTAALTQLAVLFLGQRRLDDMIKADERALSRGALDLELAKMYLDYYQQSALQLETEAHNLRQPRTQEQNRPDGRYLVTTYPSAADLARAKALDERGAAIRRQSFGPLAKVRERDKDQISGHLADAEYHQALGKYDQAIASAESALRIDPWHLEAHEFLIELCPKVNLMSKGVEHRDILDNLFAPSADRSIAPVWDLLEQTKYASALDAVNAGEVKDPASARVAAYRAIVLASAGKNDQAEAAFRVAAALEAANLLVQGHSPAADAKAPLSAETAGRYLAVHLAWARMLRPTDRAGAMAKLDLVLRIAARVPSDQWDYQIISGSLPTVFDRTRDGRRDGITVRELVALAGGRSG